MKFFRQTKETKRKLSFFLAIAMMVSLLPVSPVVKAASETVLVKIKTGIPMNGYTVRETAKIVTDGAVVELVANSNKKFVTTSGAVAIVATGTTIAEAEKAATDSVIITFDKNDVTKATFTVRNVTTGEAIYIDDIKDVKVEDNTPSSSPTSTSSNGGGISGGGSSNNYASSAPSSSAAPSASAAPTKKPGTSTAVKVGKKVTAGKLTYKITSVGGTKTVQFTGAKKNAKVVKIPATIKINGKTYKVTTIANGALKGNKKLTKLTIGKNINKIGKNAFKGCKNLKNVIVKTKKLTAKKVGANAFKNTNKNAKFTVPKGKVKKYGKIVKAKGAGKNIKVRK